MQVVIAHHPLLYFRMASVNCLAFHLAPWSKEPQRTDIRCRAGSLQGVCYIFRVPAAISGYSSDRPTRDIGKSTEKFTLIFVSLFLFTLWAPIYHFSEQSFNDICTKASSTTCTKVRVLHSPPKPQALVCNLQHRQISSIKLIRVVRALLIKPYQLKMVSAFPEVT